MSSLGLPPWVLLILLLLVVAVAWPGVGLAAQTRRRRQLRRRALFEDALKHIFAWERRSQKATPESLAGALGMSQRQVLQLVTRMETAGLLLSAAGALRLTPKGESLALNVVRAHRLWERYLADEAGVPMARLHPAAEKAEHRLTPETVDALDAHLGHPQRDPHGDPIPTADGSLDPLNAIPLTDWPSDEPARIVHIEDEPDVIFKQILAAGLLPGKTVRVLDCDSKRLVVSDGENEHYLAHVVAANIQVASKTEEAKRPAGARLLSELADGEEAEVVELGAECRGFGRRRLLDLGLTPQARVQAALANTFGDPRAFRVRGTLIALRKEQADQVWVKPIPSPVSQSQ